MRMAEAEIPRSSDSATCWEINRGGKCNGLKTQMSEKIENDYVGTEEISAGNQGSVMSCCNTSDHDAIPSCCRPSIFEWNLAEGPKIPMTRKISLKFFSGYIRIRSYGMGHSLQSVFPPHYRYTVTP